MTKTVDMTSVQYETIGDPPAFEDPRIQDFFRHWCAFCAGAIMPSRQAVDPVVLRQLLPHVWLYEYQHDRASYRCVLAGEEIHTAWGASIMGRQIEDMFLPDQVTELIHRWDYIRTAPALLYGDFSRPGDIRSAERLIVPLADDSGTAGYVMGITIYRLDGGPKARTYADSGPTTPLPAPRFHVLPQSHLAAAE